MLAAVLLVASVLIGGAGAGAQTGSDGVLFGAAVGQQGNETKQQAIERLERDLGTTLPVVRIFETWNDTIDNRLNNWIVDGGRTIHLSVKPRDSRGNPIRWSAIANAQPGSAHHNNMVRLAREVRALDGEVWLSFHHEPEADSLAWGSPAEFQNAWRKFHTIFENQNVDAEWVLTMTGWSYRVDTADRRSVGRWYPGGQYVDYVGADVYNWNQCRNPREQWRSLESTLDEVIEFADSRGKKIVLPEFASHEGGAGAKGGWIDNVRTLMKQDRYADRFAAILWFNSNDGEPGCEWELDSSTASLAAARRLANDPFFGHGGVTPTPARQPVTPTAQCTVQTQAGTDRITWQSQGADFRYNLRRNGQWLANTNAGRAYTNSGVSNGNYWVIARDGTTTRRLECVR